MHTSGSTFTSLFGTSPEKIKQICIVTPFLSKDMLQALWIKELSRGILYSAGHNNSFSLIVTRMGSGFTGDAVLHLKNTPCRHALFFGACGSTDMSRGPGSMIAVNEACAQDSFVNMLLGRGSQDTFFPDREFHERVMAKAKELSFSEGRCLTAGSLALEADYAASLPRPVDVIDMETAAVFAAAVNTGIKAAALLFVTDVLSHYPYYHAFDKKNAPQLKSIVAKASNTAVSLLTGVFRQ